ncbi:hypothetical protein [Microbacterium sp. 179-I 3D3 NHS]|uniref:hypothetical protein n=1 Tax=Microbacterium sp. 179-I 3D3 NHS TaxID=3142382 RepID=UPI0039A0D9C7
MAAWLAIRALTGGDAAVLWDWPQNSTIERIYLETATAVDDIRVENDRGDHAFIQVKHRVDAGRSVGTPLRKALDQFVRQSATAETTDRFVLVVSSESSAGVKHDLPRVLERMRREQSIDEATTCRNARERAVRGVVLGHLNAVWAESAQGGADEHDMLSLLKKLYVTTVDTGPDEPATLEAEGHLRAILAEPSHARAAWQDVVAAASETAILQTGMTSAWLADRLSSHGFQLGSLPDYRADIGRLQSITASGISRLNRFRSLPGDNRASVNITRDFEAELYDASASASLLITGEPGAGKSGVLAQLISARMTSADVVFIAADAVAGSTASELRVELGLDHDLSDVLAHWFGNRPGYLVIDALDAGRGSRTQDALFDLMRDVIDHRGRFHVIASIRSFDLRSNAVLAHLFSGQPASADERYQVPGLSRTRHFLVPPLSDTELGQVVASAPQLAAAIASAGITLRQLLRNPFCLWIFAQLAGDDSLPDYAVDTTSKLLGAYWDWRIRKDARVAGSNELALKFLCDLALRTGTLAVDRFTIDAGHMDAVTRLLRDGVLVEVAGARGPDVGIGFAHHVLFDYALSRVVIRYSHNVAELIVQDNARGLLVARPSFDMFFEYLWSLDLERGAFWQATLDLAREAVPEVAKTISPAVAARLISGQSDWIALMSLLDDQRLDALAIVRHLVGAHLASETELDVGAARVWGELCADLSRRLDDDVAPVVRALVHDLSQSPVISDAEVAGFIGSAARALFRWCAATGRNERFYLHVAIAALVATFESDRDGSDELIRQIIEPQRLADLGYFEMPALAHGIVRLADTAPQLVRDIYVAAFEHEETSQDATSLSQGILGLTSNRRQDYESAHYLLAQNYEHFIAVAEREAIAALSAILRMYSSRLGGGDESIVIPWNGVEVQVIESNRYWTMDSEYDSESKLLASFGRWLADQLATSSSLTNDPFVRVLDHVRGLAAPAAIWRTLISAARPDGARLAGLSPLFEARGALLSRGLGQPIRQALRLGFASLPAEARADIEVAVLSLSTSASGSREQIMGARLLTALPAEALITQEARDKRAAIVMEESDSDSRTYNTAPAEDSYEDWRLRENGVDPAHPEHSLVISALQPVRAIRNQPTPMEVERALDGWRHVRAAKAVLEAQRQRVPTRLTDWARNEIGRALEPICRSTLPLALDPSALEELGEIAISVATTADDSALVDLETFDATPALSDSGRVAAVVAMMHMIHQGAHRERLSRAVLELTGDYAVAVRFAIARGLYELAGDDSPFTWDLIDALARDDSGAVRTLVVRLEAQMVDRPSLLLERLVARYEDSVDLGARGKPVREVCVGVVVWRWLWRNDDTFRDVVLQWLAESEDASVAGAMQDYLRAALAADGVAARAIRQRGFTMALAAIAHVKTLVEAIVNSPDPGASAALSSSLWHVADAISSDVYFASGAYGGRDGERRLPDRAFFDDAADLLDALTAMPHPSIIHHILQVLDYSAPVEPSMILCKMAEVLSLGRAGGYQYDRIGASFMVGVAQRYLAEHRSIFQTDDAARGALIEVLDTFVAAGWPDATRLAYQLESVYR